MKKIIPFILIASFLFACNTEEKKGETTGSDSKTGKASAPVEIIMDSNFVNSSKASVAAFEKKDVEGYIANMDDNIKFRWSSGDSLIGKQAVRDYWTNRFKIIDVFEISNEIYLPLNANESPNGGVTAAGKWMLTWYMVHVKYTNGKELYFWTHQAQHFNSANKMDESALYMDRHPVIEATKDLVK